MADILRESGWPVVEAEDGQDAFERALLKHLPRGND
jgi:hypothetical protein